MGAVITKLKPLEKANSIIAAKHVFFAAIVLSTMFVAKDIPTAATDMVKVYYSENFLARLDVDEIIFLVLHEIMHILLKHGLRRGDRDPKLWNIACDHKINFMLKKMGFKLIHHPEWKDFDPVLGFKLHCNPAYEALSEEQIYDLLIQEKKEALREAIRKADASTPVGVNRYREDHDGLGRDVMDVPATPEDKAKIADDIDKIVARAATIARAIGKMPAGLEHLIDEYFDAQISWEVLLKRFANRFARKGSSWMVRNRRHHNMYLPGKCSTQLGEVIIIADSSGSMFDAKIFKYVGSEINDIIQSMRPELVRVVWSDAQACNHYEEFKPGQEVILHPKGGGGTDMRLPLEHIKQFKPIFAILITDGYTPWPDQKLPYPLIICCTTAAKCPEWAMTVRVTIPA